MAYAAGIWKEMRGVGWIFMWALREWCSFLISECLLFNNQQNKGLVLLSCLTTLLSVKRGKNTEYNRSLFRCLNRDIQGNSNLSTRPRHLTMLFHIGSLIRWTKKSCLWSYPGNWLLLGSVDGWLGLDGGRGPEELEDPGMTRGLSKLNTLSSPWSRMLGWWLPKPPPLWLLLWIFGVALVMDDPAYVKNSNSPTQF